MKKVYIISRYKAITEGQQEFNIAVAQYYARQTVFEGKLPIVSHIYFTQFLDDFDKEERKRGLDLGIRALHGCDEYLLVIVDGIVSEGMRAEIDEVSKLKMPGRIVTTTRKELSEMIGKSGWESNGDGFSSRTNKHRRLCRLRRGIQSRN